MLAHQRVTLNLDGIELVEPDLPVQEGEVVVGELSLDLRGLFSLAMHLRIQHEQLHCHLYMWEGAEDHDEPELREQHNLVHLATKYVEHMLSYRFYGEFGKIDGAEDGVEIRKGWMAVQKVSDTSRPRILVMGAGGIGVIRV